MILSQKKQIFQVAIELLVLAGAISLALFLLGPDSALAQAISLPSSDKYGLPAPADTSAEGTVQAKSTIAAIVRVVRLLLGGIAVFMIILAAFRMILAHGNEDEISKQRQALTWGIIGIAMVAMSGEVEKIFSLEGGGILRDPKTILQRTKLFNNQIQILITFIKYLIGSIAVLMIVRSSMILITNGGEEEKATQAKKNLTWGGIGLVMIIVADNFVNNVFFRIDRNSLPGSDKSDPKVAVGRGIDELVGFTNFMLAIVGPILILMFVAGGILYVTSRGEEEQVNKAKKILTAAFIGTIIVYGSFAIVSTFISGQFG